MLRASSLNRVHVERLTKMLSMSPFTTRRQVPTAQKKYKNHRGPEERGKAIDHLPRS